MIAQPHVSQPALPTLRIRHLLALLAAGVAGIVALSFAGALSLITAGVERSEVGLALDSLSKLTKLLLKFDVAGEQTVAAWFSSILLLICASICLYIAVMPRSGQRRYWAALGVIFVGLSMDEAVGFHEMMINPVRDTLGTSGPFLYAWVIPGLVFVALVGIAYLGFLLQLEERVRNQMVLAGMVFVTGALGFEMMEGAFAEFYREHRLVHEIALHIEDTLEFAGVLLFLSALLTYVTSHDRMMSLRLK
jgi:hypothetical protein